MDGVGCALCHGKDGRGGTMHGMPAPNITYSVLTDPKGYRDPRGRKRPPYNDETLKAAIMAGIDSGGNTLDPEMPRWSGFTPKDLEDLIGYLKMLDRPSDSGSGGSVRL
jgi:mono/diheme cytochrome c family protein